MDKKIILGVFALVVISISALLLFPSVPVDTPETLPWNITHPAPGKSRIFGITLGQNSLNDLQRVFNMEQAEVSLYKTDDGKMLVEGFYDELNLNGLKAKFAVTIAVPEDELDGMFNRGLRMNSALSGKRITLAFDDLERARNTPISSLTYLPNVRLEESIIIKRFGEPAQRIRESKSGVVHLLYPEHGLDVSLSGNEKPVFQYISPSAFDQLSKPLQDTGEPVK